MGDVQISSPNTKEIGDDKSWNNINIHTMNIKGIQENRRRSMPILSQWKANESDQMRRKSVPDLRVLIDDKCIRPLNLSTLDNEYIQKDYNVNENISAVLQNYDVNSIGSRDSHEDLS